ncbi:MAG: ribbon-helix-helix protein, CopG family [Melioribacteraceae bacterium]
MTTKIKSKSKPKNRKVKIGTVIDSELLDKVRERAIRDGRTISDIIQDALRNYNELDLLDIKLRVEAARRFCSRPLNLSRAELEEIMDEDIYEV